MPERATRQSRRTDKIKECSIYNLLKILIIIFLDLVQFQYKNALAQENAYEYVYNIDLNRMITSSAIACFYRARFPGK